MRKISSFLLAVLCACILAGFSQTPTFNASCEDVEKIYIFNLKGYEKKGDSYDQNDNEEIFFPLFFFTPEKAREVFNFIIEKEGRPVTLYLNSFWFSQSSDAHDFFQHDEAAFKKSLSQTKTRWFMGTKVFSDYEDALKYAEQFCPQKIVRGKKNIMTEWPK